MDIQSGLPLCYPGKEHRFFYGYGVCSKQQRHRLEF